MAIHANYFREAAPVEVLASSSGGTARLKCSQCGGHEDWHVKRLPPPEALPKYFKNKGWSIRKRVTCPECTSKPKERKSSNMNMKTNVAPIRAEKPDPETAKKIRRLVFAALEDYYDDAAKSYREGHSDLSIANEIGTSASFVEKTREENFGPIAPPSEVTALRADFAMLEGEFSKLKSRFDSLCSKQGWRQ